MAAIAEKKHIVLSIDIGVKNLGWTIFASDNSFKTTAKQPFENISVTFNIFNITNAVSANASIVTERCNAVSQFMKQINNNFIIDYVVIERQVPSNIKAMELMYAITTAAHCYTETPNDVIIFDPKLKFQMLNIDYDTENKHHKRQSIVMCRTMLITLAECKVEAFDQFDKQDDVSDSFNQAFEWLCENRKLAYTLKEMRSTVTPALKILN